MSFFSERVEPFVKSIELMASASKSILIVFLCVFGIIAITFPSFAKDKLKAIGIKLNKVEVAGIELVAEQTEKSNTATIKIAEALTSAEVKLAELNKATESGNADDKSKTIKDVLDNIKLAQTALDVQSKAIVKTAAVADLTPSTPTTGWIFIGVFSPNYELKWPSSRVWNKNNVTMKNGKPSEVVLKYDEQIASTGIECGARTSSDSAESEKLRKKKDDAIIKASTEPLQIVDLAECPTRYGDKTVWGKISVPPARVRASALNAM
jgi:hypothetical protein